MSTCSLWCVVVRPNDARLTTAEGATNMPRPFSFHPVRERSSIDEVDGEIIEQEGIIDTRIL